MEKEKFNCPGCGAEINMDLHEFVDVTEDASYKEKILNGDFFLAECPACGGMTLAEYPVMYMDPSKKLTVYMAPGAEDELLDQMNSLEIPEADIDQEAVFRLVENSDELVEKILIADGGRDDRVIELYKAVLAENFRESMPGITADNMLYYTGEDGEFFFVFGMGNEEGEELTVDIDEEIYQDLAAGYMEALVVEPNKYARVNADWLSARIEVEA